MIGGCSEGEDAEGWCDGGGCWGHFQMKVDDPLW